ncbi:TAXI family TRAP transporter solute-binding subunit [Motiliproteus sp. MSK22-1]|uniref:TAXI family TRAP transporter solute-binding subunit n=1 Tax=Motiliproteus sp. MSK22-1 TaxID=1897630 RepID=UPI000977DD0A|nr:TAXI family TRAP transporter solute-binding subunit [Motiliproteus sp. MSK22-1]OMH25940.1 C4-dicarboxylate ABC transporter substrate-binding protein [Motiliproteus sp. MSK22-1]
MMRLVLLASLVGIARVSSAESSIVTLGTGGFTGVYYPAGGAICRLVNNERSLHGIRCSVESTGGSVDNLQRVRDGDLDLGIAQSDWIHHAYQGSDLFKSAGPDTELRALFYLYPEYFTMIARADSGIKSFDQLLGKRVNVGARGSGQRATLDVLMRLYQWDNSVFSEALELDPAEQASALCNNRIDVMIYTLGHPSGATKEVTRECESRLIALTGKPLKELIAKNSFYHRAIIPGGLYRGNREATPTLGVMATFFTTSEMSDDTVYSLVKSVFENFQRFRELHPVFADLDKEAMVAGKFSIPVHPGALRYYRESGLLKEP